MCDPFCLLCCQSVALFVCLSVLGIVFPPNAALYWLCEFLNRNWPNSLQEFRSLLQIMGQFGEIYWAHICPPDPRNISTSKIKFYPMSSMAWKSICEIRMSKLQQNWRIKLGFKLRFLWSELWWEITMEIANWWSSSGLSGSSNPDWERPSHFHEKNRILERKNKRKLKMMFLRKIMHYPYEVEIEDSQQVFCIEELLRMWDGFSKMPNYLEPKVVRLFEL